LIAFPTPTQSALEIGPLKTSNKKAKKIKYQTNPKNQKKTFTSIIKHTKKKQKKTS